MNIRNTTRIKVLFSNLHNELLSDKSDAEYKIAALLHLLITELKYTPEFPIELPADSAGRFLSTQMLEGYDILVLGSPTKDLREDECQAIEQFLAQGGGLLLLCNSDMLMDAWPGIEGLCARLGIELHEYHHGPPETINLFSPHALTAMVNRLQVSDIAVVTPKAEARPVAYVEIATEPEIIRETIAACLDLQDRQNSGNGRIVVIGDVSFCSDSSLEQKDNKQFILNTFQWLARRNPLDIKKLAVTEIIHLGETGQVGVTLDHGNAGAEPYIECILESGLGAAIDQPRKGMTIRAKKSVPVSWQVTPQNFGKQGLQCTIRIEKRRWNCFTLLPDMHCLAPGHLRLEILDNHGKPKLTFDKGEAFIVKGVFHSSSTIQPTPLMKLACYEGLAYGDPFSEDLGIWNLKAIEPGTHRITLSIPATGQTSSAFVTVKLSEEDQRTELYIAYVNPLDAEIAGRLEQVDKRFCRPAVKDASFEIALLDDYVKKLYEKQSGAWLREILTAVKQEKKRDIKLISQIMAYFFPSYQPRFGESLIPYAPGLVSYLAQVYPAERKRLEYNFLCSEETDEIDIKRHIAAYLLHEKYGHGFFYTQTQLGRQISILERHGFPEAPDSHSEYQHVAGLIEDSSIVVNEGFGAWMEITFLKQLADHKVREASERRHEFLILEASGFLQKPVYRDFFENFPPRYDSKYREGFEYLDFIARSYNIHCAVEAFLIAMQIDFGVSENESTGAIEFNKYTPEKIEMFFQRQEQSVEEESVQWLSHLRLRQITEILYEFKEKLELPVRRQYSLGAIDDESYFKTFITDMTQHLKGRACL